MISITMLIWKALSLHVGNTGHNPLHVVDIDKTDAPERVYVSDTIEEVSNVLQDNTMIYSLFSSIFINNIKLR